jgi:hypothetical protein
LSAAGWDDFAAAVAAFDPGEAIQRGPLFVALARGRRAWIAVYDPGTPAVNLDLRRDGTWQQMTFRDDTYHPEAASFLVLLRAGLPRLGPALVAPIDDYPHDPQRSDPMADGPGDLRDVLDLPPGPRAAVRLAGGITVRRASPDAATWGACAGRYYVQRLDGGCRYLRSDTEPGAPQQWVLHPIDEPMHGQPYWFDDPATILDRLFAGGIELGLDLEEQPR